MSQRSRQDAVTTQALQTLHAANYGVYGARKVHAELRREGHVVDRGDGPQPVARCTVERLIRATGPRGITRSQGPRTTVPGNGPDTRPDLVQRAFTATAPNQLWVADITYCRTFTGWAYAAFVVDVFSRRVVAWQLSKSLRTDLALDALEIGIWTRRHAGRDVTGLTHHSRLGRPVRRRPLHPAPRRGRRRRLGRHRRGLLRQCSGGGVQLAVQSELVRNKGPWRSIDDLQIAVAEYIDWFNHRRLHGEIGLLPPVEYETNYYRHNPAPTSVGASLQSLH